jgi:hypothetical protein
MKKIVLISDGKNFSTNAFQLVKSLHQNEAFFLTGAFFHSVNYGLLVPTTFATTAEPYLDFLEEEHAAYDRGILQFKSLCEQSDIEYGVHKKGEEWNVNELVKESRFSDLIAVSAELFFPDFFRRQPNAFLQDVLCNAECPVLVIPENISSIKRIAVAYDGSRESMFAMKMFCYVFPALTALPLNVYYWVNHTDDEIPYFDYLEEFAGRHFPNLNFRERFFDPTKYLAQCLDEDKNSMLVCGSYHRSKVSNLFKKSFAEEIIKKHSAPVFIAHSF